MKQQMTNRVVGIIGSAVCSVSVLCFAVSMIVGIFVNTLFLSCFASMFIALGFMLFMCAVSGSNKDNEKRACGNVSLVCAAIYVTLIFLVYFAECTTVNLSPRLDEKILSIMICSDTALWHCQHSSPAFLLIKQKSTVKHSRLC